jgi:hypothetical protein
MSAARALDCQKVLPELIGQALHLEISRHERYCIDIQLDIATYF